MAETYRYRRSDFKPLPVKLEHLDIELNFVGHEVHATNTLRMTAREPITELRLDARELDVHSVEWVGGGIFPLSYEDRREAHALGVRLPRRLAAGETFSIRTRTTCVPSDNVLEGIYKDTTPPGGPQQYISQCEQWGFQRIMPVLDDCTAKCTMVTTIEADARYTHLISNGNISRSRNPLGRPVLNPGDPSRQVITYENPIPMAPYLFIVAVGMWDMVEDVVVYPSGRRVKIEYLVPPGRAAGALLPLKILKDSMLWQNRTQEYEYRYDVYRTICMDKSNFGGMENVGNTTIVTAAALIDEFTNDARLEYAYNVIIHEFEHNQCGSDVTMATPFDMWLNEAFTVDVERQYSATQFDPACVRLDDVDAMRAPIGGPLAIEDAGHMGQIVREGFNDPDELVDGVTYVKAAEVIRMLRLILGEARFREAKNLYFRRHDGGNASTDQFFACFEEASGTDLSQFRREWLHTIGYPHVEADYAYDADARSLRVKFTQRRVGRGGLFHVPVEIAAVDAAGRDIPGSARVVELHGQAAGGSAAREVTIECPSEPAFVSINRDASFYGTFFDRSATPDRLAKQVRLDPNPFNRVEAMRRLTDTERIRLMEAPGAAVGEAWLDLYGSLLRDGSLPHGLKAYLLRIEELSVDRRFLPWYRERCAARVALMRTVAERFGPDLKRAFDALDTYARGETPKDGIEARRLKAVLLRIVAESDTPAAHGLCDEHFRRAWNLTDRLSALECINASNHPERDARLDVGHGLWRGHPAAYASYLSLVGARRDETVFDRIAREEARPGFELPHPSHSRSLYLGFTANNRMLWTTRGIAWVRDTVIKMASVNENTANRVLACFQMVRCLAGDLQAEVRAALNRMQAGIDASRAPSVAGRVQTYLEG